MTGPADPAHAEVVAVGEPLVALVARERGPLAEVVDFRRHVAGAELNVAIGLARLGHRTSFVGRVGDDGFGKAILRRLRSEGVDTGYVTVDSGAQTGILIRERRWVGPPAVTYYRAGSAGSRLCPADVDGARGVIASARWLHLTGITPALSPSCREAVDRAVVLARRSGLTIGFDLNLRRQLWADGMPSDVLQALAASVDVLFAGVDEIDALGMAFDSVESTLRRLQALGPSIVVLKSGPQGAAAIDGTGVVARQPSFGVPVIEDPVGAGDALAAGFTAGILSGRSLAEALADGVACGAAVVGVEGDVEGLPDRPELERIRAGDIDTRR